MNNETIEELAEELGFASSIIQVLMKRSEQNENLDSMIVDEDDALLEYANGHIEKCFKLLLRTSK